MASTTTVANVLEPVFHLLPVSLRNNLFPVVSLNLLRRGITSSLERITTRQSQGHLQVELAEQCSLLNQQKAELDDDSSQNRLRSQLAELRSKEDRIKE